MYFIKPSPSQIAEALESWQWLPIKGKKPFLVTAFGDVFFADNDGIWFLDTLEGKIEKICQTTEELKEILNTEDGQDHYLLTGYVMKAQKEGMVLNEGQCYDWILSPVLGGKIEYENINVIDFVVAVNVSGQIHEQVKDLPPGTKISNITVDGEKT